MPKTAGIILIGNEILSGKIADVNAAYLCRELRQLGVDVLRISVVPDEVELIAREVVAQSRDFDVVFTSGGVGPTHDDVTIEGVARAMGVPVVRHPRLVATLEGYYRGELNDAHLKMAETPEGAELVGGEPVRFPTVLVRNVYVLPGVPEIFRAKFEALRERFRDDPIHLKNVFVSIGEGELADYLNGLLADFPLLLLGSYPEFSSPEYRVKVTLESRDPGYLEKALAELLRRLPVRAVMHGGPRVGLLAGLMVATNLGVFLCGRIVEPDLVFLLWLTLAWAGFAIAYRGRGRRGLVLFYAALGLAPITKDIVGALAPLVVVAMFFWLTGERPLTPWVPWWSVLLLAAIALPWYVLVEARNRGFLWYTLVDNHVLRFARQRVFPDEDVPLGSSAFLLVTLLAFLPRSEEHT